MKILVFRRSTWHMLDVMNSNEIGNKNKHDDTKQIYNEKAETENK